MQVESKMADLSCQEMLCRVQRAQQDLQVDQLVRVDSRAQQDQRVLLALTDLQVKLELRDQLGRKACKVQLGRKVMLDRAVLKVPQVQCLGPLVHLELPVLLD
jgi:type II secretory pathway component HofQ